MKIKQKIAKTIGASKIVNLMENINYYPKIIFYHGVTEEKIVNKYIQANQLSFEQFKNQIQYLKRKFIIISLKEMEIVIKEKKNIRRNLISITFDDGYENNFYTVAPFMDKMKIPYSIFLLPKLIDEDHFIPTYYIRSSIFYTDKPYIEIPSLKLKTSIKDEREKIFWMRKIISIYKNIGKPYSDNIVTELMNCLSLNKRKEIDEIFRTEKLMSWKMIKQMTNNKNITFGSHGLDHSILNRNQNINEIQNQIIMSKEIIRKNLNYCDYFSFPNGNKSSICNHAIEIAKNNYRLLFGVDGKVIKNSNEQKVISRIGVAADFDIFKAQISVFSY